MTRNTPKGARDHARDLASFAFNTAMQSLKPTCPPDTSSVWLDAMTDVFEEQIEEILRAAAEPEAKADGPRVGDVLESKDGKRRTVARIDTTGRLFVRTAIGGFGTIYPNKLHLYRVVRP